MFFFNMFQEIYLTDISTLGFENTKKKKEPNLITNMSHCFVHSVCITNLGYKYTYV